MHILSPETDNCPSWITGREEMNRRKYFIINLHKRKLPTQRGSNSQPPDHQLDVHQLSHWCKLKKWLSKPRKSVKKKKKKKKKKNKEYTKVICISSDHEENICKLLKRFIHNCRRSCVHKVPTIYIIWAKQMTKFKTPEKVTKNNFKNILKAYVYLCRRSCFPKVPTIYTI